VIAIDTQILIYAHRRESAWHDRALDRLRELAASAVPWAIPMHCLTEFYAQVTQRGAYRVASTPAQAIAQIDEWLSSPRVAVLDESGRTWHVLRDLLSTTRTIGPRAYDARIAAVCIQHGVTELWTNDRDYLAFPALRVRNPLVDIQPIGAKEPRVAYRTRTPTPGRRRRPRPASARK
jgi:toxin-antitoxin system PIN domain toxin